MTSAITGEHYSARFSQRRHLSAAAVVPFGQHRSRRRRWLVTDTYVIQIKDEVSLISRNQTMKLGGNYNYLPDNGSLNANEHFATLIFFDDPSVILSNSNGRYPQGFATPGIVRQWQQANGGALNGVGSRQFADRVSNCRAGFRMIGAPRRTSR